MIAAVLVAISLWIGFRSRSLKGIQAEDQFSFRASPFLQAILALSVGVLAFGFVYISLKGAKDGAEVFWLELLCMSLFFIPLLGMMVLGLLGVRRSYVIITKDKVEHFDGWKTKRAVARRSILSVRILPLAMIVRVKCTGEKEDLLLPMIYSKTSLMIALLKQKWVTPEY